MLDETENPFLADAYAGRPGAAFQAQLFSLLARHRQQGALRQGDLFNQVTVCDYLFDRDKIYAYVTLDDNELFIYQRLYDLLARDVPPPDLVDLPAGAGRRRWPSGCGSGARAAPERPRAGRARARRAADAYNHFFFHYTATPLLVVETSQVDPAWPDEAVDEILRQLHDMHGRHALRACRARAYERPA